MTACVYRELYGKIADRNKNCVNKVFLPQMGGEEEAAEIQARMTPRASKSAREQTNYSARIFLELRTEHILKPII